MWTFHFLHPRGGFGMVQVHASRHDTGFKVAIAAHWWIDDPAKDIRSLLSTDPVSLRFEEPNDVASHLEAALSGLLRRNAAELTQLAPIEARRSDRHGNLLFGEFERAQRLPT